MTYERSVGRKLKRRISLERFDADLVQGQWYSFTDENGFGCCQTDIELHFPAHIILLEVKLTQTRHAEGQMLDLYLPVLKEVHGKPVIPVQVCKNMRHKADLALRDIEDLIAKPEMKLWTWHYLADR